MNQRSPIGSKVMIAPDKETENKVGDIILAKSAVTPFQSGIILEVGTGVTDDKFKKLKSGARAFFFKKAGHKMHPDEDKIIMFAEDIWWIE